MNIIKQIYKLSDIKYPWVLLLSITAFVASFCVQRYFDIEPHVEMATYGLGFAVALIWSILNYVGHLKLNTLYKKHDDINVFVERMKMSKDEKAELVEYLNDFVKDLEEKGETHESAVKKAISHFQVQEFSEARGGDIFEKPTHYYLMGYVSIFVGTFLVINFLDSIISIPFIMSAVSFTLSLFSIGLFVLFFLYKLIDVLLTKK